VSSSAARHIRFAYIATVVGVGVVTVGWSLRQLSADPPGAEWFILAALTLFTGSFTVKLPSLQAKISVSDTFVFTSALLFGPAAGAITVVLDALVISLWMKRQQRSAVRVLFNITAPAIAIWVASESFFFLAGVSPGQIDRTDVGQMIIPAFSFAFFYFVINTGLVAGALATETKESALAIWLENFPPVSITYFVGSSIAMLIVAYTDKIDITVLSIIVPLLVISHLTFRSSMGRLEDAERHVTQVNEMYLSTVETLAMAVDAKDQITHGHIRRVQVYATELAKHLGVSNPEQLRALEAAALLHDMGKLAMPEHILNKPGKLTSAEFSEMKRHADIGADLLSSIRFPYPVVPIVRHHHENWDGTGYPTGISETDIPIGARILSVVDCFDALNSDRPYRPRLSTDEAFAILRRRRGTMYDPWIVDSFIAVYPHIAELAEAAGQQARGLLVTRHETRTRWLGTEERVRTQKLQITDLYADLNAARREVENARDDDAAFGVVERYVQRLTDTEGCALFRYSSGNNSLLCVQASTGKYRSLRGYVVYPGERVSGWVWAHKRTISNANAALELIDVPGFSRGEVYSALSTPVEGHSGTELLGVLTAYAPHADAFEPEHIYVFERLSTILGDYLSKTARVA
jgi:putative nucleotidyltransferase with HDIG domain